VTFALSLLFFSMAQSSTQPMHCGLDARRLAAWRLNRENRFPFSDKDLARRTPKKKGLRHIAAARKYNREEFRLDPNLRCCPLIQIKHLAHKRRMFRRS